MDLQALLKERFGYSHFRPGQEEVIKHVLNKRDCIAILPTGMGKSLCYQLPGYIMPGSVLIISPLVSLMEDQVMQMRKNGEKRVVALNSFLSFTERSRILASLGNYKFIFVSPEMLSHKSFGLHLKKIEIGLIVIDEAHCISQWGFDFRPDYLRIGEFLSSYNSPILALTATADSKVINDITRYLKMNEPIIQRHSLDRPNISYSIIQLNSTLEKTDWIKERILQTTGPGIIYTSSRKRADELAFELQEAGVAIQSYHAGKEQDDRAIIQEQFLNNELEWISATNAFGMGVHKSDIRQVIHEHLPSTIAAYLQEVGRAGRDGRPAAATLLYIPVDERMTSFIIQSDRPDESQLRHYANMLSEGRDPSESAELAGMTDTGKRIVDYYLERHTLDEVLEVMDTLSAEKETELRKMLHLVRSEQCVREMVLSYFGEQCNEKPEACCSICGLEVLEWLTDKSLKKKTNELVSWDERITNLLG
ncbi:RecQ family ATP-dependent DNA helicase [Sporosarcina highlanderae]|uniref:ATP-dependent DNA helicase RecQ n=1 Tax=Sporosarcina highlanderae TaxID=3035916 RepID=A0ABT8JUE8_9BACL|nr:ATP-dependent DNA helicase RecQ [Sporosarcina highlanderae]MDN4608760.1 ATP-dependent DNA helicase [Sporosarcina highlanderae]